MSQQPHVGLSLINKAPIGILITLLIAVLSDAKVAPWLRADIPLIFYNDELVQVVGYFVSDNHKDENGVIWEYKS
ncbi:tRNA lysidine(34) synthetase TilS [Pseudoalteromonas sp. US3C1013]|uniref:tRNA lysidine(34) synthetase TilS n=1 Tax=unclassified Pseudoalteromonas TaxID=194690 RepID=UPI003AB31A5F